MLFRRVRCGRRAWSALAVAALALGSVSAVSGPAGAAMPSTTPDEGTTTNISATFSPTTNLAPGDVVSGSITTTDGFGGYEVKLCKTGQTGYSLTNFGYSGASASRCVKQAAPGGISSGGLDASLTAGIQAPTYWIPTVAGTNNPETRTFSFTAGTGTVEWFNTDGFGPFSMTCDPTNPCDMVVRVSHGGSTSWYIQPLTYIAAPGTPASFAATAGNTQAALSWAAGTGGAPSSYALTVSPAPTGGNCSGGTCSPAPTSSATSYTVTGLDNFTAYTFSLTASNGAGTSSAATTAATPAPSAPAITSLTPGNTNIVVAFGAVSPAPSSGYKVTAYNTTGATTCGSTVITTATGSSSPITVTGLTNGTNYCFKVQGDYGSGNLSAFSSAQYATPGAPIVYNTINVTVPEGVLVLAQRCAGSSGPWDTAQGDAFDPSNADKTSPFTAQLTPATRCTVDLSGPRSSHVVDSVTTAETRTVFDGTITAGSTTLTSASAAFVSGDVGQQVTVAGVTRRIVARASATSVTLDSAVSSTFDNAEVTVLGRTITAGAGAFVSTDNTKRIQGTQIPGGTTVTGYGTIGSLTYLDLSQPANDAATGQSVRIFDQDPTPARLVTTGPDAGKYLVATGAINQVYVVDYRADNPGWSLTGQSSKFCDGSGATTGDANNAPAAAPRACSAGDKEFPAHWLGWTPKVRTTDGPVGTTVTQGTIRAPGSTTGLDVSRTLASAASGAGAGVSRLDADLLLYVPIISPAGSYQATLTLTVL